MGQLSIWFQNRMCISIADEDQQFKKDDFKYFATPDIYKIASKCNVYIRCDLAFSKKEYADFSAFIVGGIDDHDNLFILDCDYGRWHLDERLKHLFDLIRKWKSYVRNVGIEKTGSSEDFIQMVEKLKSSENCFFPTAEIKPGKIHKEERIMLLQPKVKAHKFYLPETAWWLPELESEFIMFSQEGTRAAHDDLIEACAYLLQQSNTPVLKTGTDDVELSRISEGFQSFL